MTATARARAAAIAIILVNAALSGACSRDDSPSGPSRSDGTAQTGANTDSRIAIPLADSRTPASTRELPDFTALVDHYGDAVVNVSVVGRADSEGGEDSLLEFFRRFGMPDPHQRGEGGDAPSEGPLMRGAGSGFIVSSDGYILTNAHVVAHAEDVTVRLTDRREFPATVIGTDSRTDVAVIKIDAKDLPVVAIGDEKTLKTGEWVLAIGSPFGLDNTATAGIVSGTSRALGGDSIVPFIQTDVAVNPGNSGGPLFNLKGEVVGINSMIFSQSGGYMGISFAIPIAEAMEVREQLIKTGRVVRGRIGVVVQDVDAALAKSFELDRPRGALVAAVEEGGPAEQGGVKPGDVVLEFDGKSIEQSNELSNAVAKTKPGSNAELKVWRGGKERELNVKVATLADPDRKQAKAAPANRDAENARLGLVVRALTDDEKERVGTDGNVVVADVRGSAARAGIQPGDIILAVNSQSVKSVQELRNVAGKLRNGESAALLVERGGTQIFVPVKAG
jgi:serine protease Do